jgi:hypothetical protein
VSWYGAVRETESRASEKAFKKRDARVGRGRVKRRNDFVIDFLSRGGASVGPLETGLKLNPKLLSFNLSRQNLFWIRPVWA